MDHEEGERRPFDPILLSAPTPDERRDQCRPRPEAESLRTEDAGRPFIHFGRQASESDEPTDPARDHVDRIEDRPVTFGNAEELSRAESAPIAARPAPDLDALTAALASLEKQISRAGREQFKASTLAEAQRAQLNVVLETLRDAEAARDDEVEALREHGSTIALQARREVARAILPAVDGLDGALRSGKHLLAAPARPAPRRSWWRRAAPTETAEDILRGDLRAWLIGLEFVRERLLSVLAAEDITPIAALGLPFDPQIHLAVEVSRPGSEAPAGTITAVIRQGYLSGGRVLRPAEVAVARAD
ncbi:MAG: nucleotide exchange factor GrpE [Chloroflexota bacterium]